MGHRSVWPLCAATGSWPRVSGSSPRDREITRLIIGLGSELGLRVVAEGVEDEETLDVLRTLGCSVAQGFHISRPLLENLLR